MTLEAKEEKGQSPIPAPEITASLASAQCSPDHKQPTTPVPLNPACVSVSHLGTSTPRLPGLIGQRKALEEPRPAAAEVLPLLFLIPDTDPVPSSHPGKDLPMAHSQHASGPSTRRLFHIKVPFPLLSWRTPLQPAECRSKCPSTGLGTAWLLPVAAHRCLVTPLTKVPGLPPPLDRTRGDWP